MAQFHNCKWCGIIYVKYGYMERSSYPYNQYPSSKYIHACGALCCEKLDLFEMCLKVEHEQEDNRDS